MNVDYVVVCKVRTMMNRLKTFLVEEDGIISVDWVILAAGVISLGLAATSVVINGTENTTTEIESSISRPSLIKKSFD